MGVHRVSFVWRDMGVSVSLCGFCLSLQDPYLLQWTMDIGYILVIVSDNGHSVNPFIDM